MTVDVLSRVVADVQRLRPLASPHTWWRLAQRYGRQHAADLHEAAESRDVVKVKAIAETMRSKVN